MSILGSLAMGSYYEGLGETMAFEASSEGGSVLKERRGHWSRAASAAGGISSESRHDRTRRARVGRKRRQQRTPSTRGNVGMAMGVGGSPTRRAGIGIAMAVMEMEEVGTRTGAGSPKPLGSPAGPYGLGRLGGELRSGLDSKQGEDGEEEREGQQHVTASVQGEASGKLPGVEEERGVLDWWEPASGRARRQEGPDLPDPGEVASDQADGPMSIEGV